MSAISERTIEAIRDIKILLKVKDWDFDSSDPGRLVITLNVQGDVQLMIQNVFLTIIRSKDKEHCVPLRKLLSGKEDLINENGLEFSIPLPVKLQDQDKVRLFCLKGGLSSKQFIVFLSHVNQRK